MEETCSTHGKDNKWKQRSGEEKHEAMRPRRKWDNIRMDLKGRVCVRVDWIQMAQNGIRNTVINFQAP
jgi:hypothetical protein